MGVNTTVIIKLAALGDIILMLPSISYIKAKNPKERIVLCVGSLAAPFLKFYPEVDDIIYINEKKILKGNLLEKVCEIVSLWFKVGFLRRARFFIGHSDFKYRVLIPFRKHSMFHPIRGIHHTKEYIRHLDPTFNTDHYVFRTSTIAHRNSIVVLAPGGAKNLMREDSLRRWPVEYYVRLGKMLVERGVPLVLIGSESDLWVNEHFENLPVESLIGKLSLEETLNLISESEVIVSHDSGPIHFSNLVGTRVISIFGPTLADEKIPFSNQGNHYFQGGKSLSCSPCYNGREYADCKRPVCMEEITPEMVFEKVMESFP